MKKVLALFDECDFSLIGLSCHAKDYRLSWEINKAMQIDLIKPSDDIELPVDNSRYVSISTYFDEDNHMEYILAANNNRGELLVPEHPQLDYFVKIEGPQHELERDRCKAIIRSIDIVLAVVEINPNQLKSKLNLFF